MTQKQIISDLGFDANYWLAKKYAAKLMGLFSLINDIEKMDGFKVCLNGIKGNLQLVNELPELNPDNYNSRFSFDAAVKQQDFCRYLFGEFENWQHITISHNSGSYSFPFPINNRLYNVIAGMAGVEITETKKEVTVLNTITVDSGIFATMAKAVKFISKDNLRPAMQHICLDFENYVCEVVATDAHRLYLSPKFEGSEKSRVQILINEQTAKILAKIKPDSDLTEISILDNDRLMINGDIYDNSTDWNYMKFPDYRCVMPDYKDAMQFEVKPFIANVKKVYPYSNKITGQVNFHLNGSIAMHTQDVDFSFECDAEMPYIAKTFPDTDIAFNGKLLMESLGIFKEKVIKMKTAGKSTQAGIFTNDIDTVLLMPYCS